MTVSPATLSAAIERGLLTPDQAERLRALEAELAPASALPAAALPDDDERLRFISGFGDIFVTIGLALFLGALSYFADRQFETSGVWATMVAASWLLAEFFTRRQRMALPSIVLLLVFAVSVFMLCAAVADPLTDSATGMALMLPRLPMLPEIRDAMAVVIAGLGTLIAVALHYWRFRVPITPAAGAAALIAVVIGLVGALDPDLAETIISPLLLACGLAVFALAMRFDLSDPQRLTRRTDIAFWLHMLAAPLIVHPLIRGFLWADGTPDETGAAWPMLATFAVLGLVAVLVDRRALLVSGLAYAGIAFASLVRDSGVAGSSTPLTILVLGAFILLISALWHPLRRAVLALLPAGLARRLPNPNVLSTTPIASTT
ncbi:MAG: hypothetical protein K0R27_3638 [Xanthobacteraceae bacterium]|nr:hypothetical protein [Xanthobacteraceae bacterium]